MGRGIFQLHNLVNSLEEERRSLRALAQIGQVVNSSLDLAEVLQIVMDNIVQLTGAERGFLMLKDDDGELIISMARNWEQEAVDPSEYAIQVYEVLRLR